MRRPGGAARCFLAVALLSLGGPSGTLAGAPPASADVPDRAPQRIVSLSPNLTELLFALGVDKGRIAGISRYCDYPPAELSGIARVGGIVDPSIEAILSLRPDMVLATRGNPLSALDRLRSAGIMVVAFDSQEGVAEIGRTMREIARLVVPDDGGRAREAIDRFETDLARLRRASAGIADSSRPTVYYFDPVSPDWTAGPGTHISEAIRLAGGKNVADGAPVAWPRLSLEVLVAMQPDWIVVAVPHGESWEQSSGEALAALRTRPGFRDLRAARAGSVCLVAADPLLRPGPRTLGSIGELGRCLHPELDWGAPR